MPEFPAARRLSRRRDSEPVRSEFGGNVIQKTGERESPQAEAEDIAARSRTTRRLRELVKVQRNAESAADGGSAVKRHPQPDPGGRGLAGEAREISPVADAGEAGIVIYRLLETKTARRSRRIGSTRSVPMDSSAGWTRSCATASRPGSIRSTKPPQPPPPDR